MYHVERSIGISPYTPSIEIKPRCIEIIARCQLKLARHVGKLACPLLKLTRISLFIKKWYNKTKTRCLAVFEVTWCNYNTCMVEVSSRIIARELPSVGRVYNQLRLQSTMLSFLLKL